GALQAGAVLVAGVADGRISFRPHLAFPRDVRIPGLHSRPPHHGCPARMEQLLFHGDGMETRSRVLGVNALGVGCSEAWSRAERCPAPFCIFSRFGTTRSRENKRPVAA